MPSIAVNVYVCLFVRLSVSPLAYLKKPCPNISPNFMCVLSLAVAQPSSDGNAMQCVMYTSGFVDDVMFSHNGANGPESKTTPMFRPVRQVAAPATKLLSTIIF